MELISSHPIKKSDLGFLLAIKEKLQKDWKEIKEIKEKMKDTF